jgi:ketosteroid isomerase-like protein
MGDGSAAGDLKSIAMGFLRAIYETDLETLAATLADDVVWWMPRSGAERLGFEWPILGRGSVMPLLSGIGLYEPGSQEVEYLNVIRDDDIVVLQYMLHARTRAGVPYENDYALILRFRGDQIAETWENADTAYAFDTFARTAD